MYRHLIFLVLTLIALDAAPECQSYEGVVGLLIASVPLMLIASNQKRLFKRPKRDLILLTELFLFTLLFFYWVGIPHTLFSITLFLFIYFLTVGIGMDWEAAFFLFPFSLPFIVLFGASKLFSGLGNFAFIALAFILLLVVFLVLPLVFQFIWQCKPLPSSPLKHRLDDLCQRFQFRHGGILIWNMMQRMSTAAIIGVFPKFRYILFTRNLLRTFPEEEIEAICAHEMGHAMNKHLLIYPFLLLGFVTIWTALYSYIQFSHPLIGFFAYATLLIAYIRFLIGFFSRNFEREADLNILEMGLRPAALTQALNRISLVNSLPLKKRNWHHGSLANRIVFLQRAEAEPRLIRSHHRKVRYSLATYLLINLSFWICWIFLD